MTGTKLFNLIFLLGLLLFLLVSLVQGKDTDGDGISDDLDDDDDNDGIPDAEDPDDDNDGIPDLEDDDWLGHDEM